MGKRAGRTTGGGKGAYRTMKIAVLMDAPLRATLLSEKTMARLAEWGEVAVNETDKAEKETVKQIIAGADIAIYDEKSMSDKRKDELARQQLEELACNPLEDLLSES